MRLNDVLKILRADFIGEVKNLNREIKMACGCDLMSDVLAFIKSDTLLLTGLTNSQVIRTAEMAEIPAICFVRGKKPQDDTVKLANEKKIPLLITKFSMYEACGRLYKQGLPGCDDLK